MIQAVLVAAFASLGFASPPGPSRAAPRCQTTGEDEITITCSYTAKPSSTRAGERDLSIALNRAMLSLKTDDANDMHVELTFTNTGSAPIADALTVYLAIDDDRDHNYIRRVLPTVDFRKLVPRRPLSFSETLRIAAFPPGHYIIHLWIPDPDPAQKFNPARSFLLRSVGVANPAKGLNVIGRFTVD
jgi:Domain of unknown function (DUF4832)